MPDGSKAFERTLAWIYIYTLGLYSLTSCTHSPARVLLMRGQRTHWITNGIAVDFISQALLRCGVLQSVGVATTTDSSTLTMGGI
jgi:hypothetical protein